MIEALKRLYKVRDEFRAIGSKIEVMETMFRTEHQETYKERERLKNEIMIMEMGIRSEAIKLFEADHETNREGGVKIKMITNIAFDREKALSWAKEHNMALKLDDDQFKEVMYSLKEPPEWVTIDKKPRADIPKVLKGG